MSTVPLTRRQVRSIDRIALEEYGMQGLVLMENAGRGCAERIHELALRTPAAGEFVVAILCGKGNNAGDGYVIARHLQLLGQTVRLIPLAPLAELRGDAAANASIAERAEIPRLVTIDAPELERQLFSAGMIVDCLLGSGAEGAPREPFASAIRIANHASAVRVAIDLPSGLDCDSGQPSDPTFRADHTLTLVGEKIGFRQPSAPPYLGVVQVVPIGVPRKLLLEALDRDDATQGDGT